MSIPKSFVSDAKFFGNRNRNPGKPRAPLRTFAEIAELFGITAGQLKSHVARSGHKCPDAKVKGGGAYVSSNSYYDISEFKAWWKLRQKELE